MILGNTTFSFYRPPDHLGYVKGLKDVKGHLHPVGGFVPQHPRPNHLTLRIQIQLVQTRA